jgi:hypothetical protein
MDTMSYRSVIERLDRQIAEAKKEAAKKERKNELDRKLKLIDHWTQGLVARKAELAQYGIAPEVDIDAEIRKLEDDRKALELEFSGEAVPLADGPRIELETLIREMEEADLKESSFDERWAVYANWSCRWRFVADKVGQATVDRESIFRKTYAIIRERMNEELPSVGPFIAALDPKAHGDWGLCLAESEERLRALEVQKRGQDAAEAALYDLMAIQKKYHLPEDPEGVRKLRHHVRSAARFPHMREEVAELAAPFKDLLRPEFSYLWSKPVEDPPAPSRKLQRREIAYRILRNMRSKGLFGAAHGPYERISSSGFPGHDLGRAKATVDLLIRNSVLRKKPSVIGSRISIEPRAVGVVDGFLKGEPMGITEVDAWCAVED